LGLSPSFNLNGKMIRNLGFLKGKKMIIEVGGTSP